MKKVVLTGLSTDGRTVSYEFGEVDDDGVGVAMDNAATDGGSECVTEDTDPSFFGRVFYLADDPDWHHHHDMMWSPFQIISGTLVGLLLGGAVGHVLARRK